MVRSHPVLFGVLKDYEKVAGCYAVMQKVKPILTVWGGCPIRSKKQSKSKKGLRFDFSGKKELRGCDATVPVTTVEVWPFCIISFIYANLGVVSGSTCM